MTNFKRQQLAPNLACPIDGVKLAVHEKQLVCDSGHSFDIARQGYVNLLPVQHKRSKQPGDSKEMVLARASFLNTGVYQGIADKLVECVSSFMVEGNVQCLLDAGCGEGYYFDYLYTALNQQIPSENLSFIGLDISKDAIVQAAKRNQKISWVVGTNRQPPVEDESVDVILCMFGFVNFAGFSKILKPGGVIIFVDPCGQHLKELRAIIYDESRVDKVFSGHQAGPGFIQLQQQNLRYKTTVCGDNQVNNLLLMTPHYYRASQAGRLTIAQTISLDITVDVVFSVFRKHAGHHEASTF